MKNIREELRTQTCIKCYYSDRQGDYEVYAIIRSYDHKKMDWRIHTLDSLLEVSDCIDDIEEFQNHLEKDFSIVEKIPLMSFMEEVTRKSVELGRWGL